MSFSSGESGFALQSHSTYSNATFAQSFSACGPGSDRVVAQADACAAFCTDLRGDSNGSAQLTFTAVDDAGRTQTFSTARVTLSPPQ